MDVNKNSYTFGFAAIMVVLVATLLSAAAISLKPFQDKNIESEKKRVTGETEEGVLKISAATNTY